MEDKSDYTVGITAGGETFQMPGDEFYRVGKRLHAFASRIPDAKRSLVCALSDAELIVRGNELAAAVKALAAAELAEAERRKAAKGIITEKENIIARLAETVKAKSEWREVIVVSNLVSTASGVMVAETRTDTGEVLGMRQTTVSEMQTGMQL